MLDEMKRDQHQKDDDSKMALLYETTAIRTGALLATNVVFIAEFNFNTSKPLHILALSLFAASTPLLSIVILAANWWKAGERFSNPSKPYHFGPATNFGSLLTIVGVGLCIWSYSWIPCVLYSLGSVYALAVIARISGVAAKVSEESSRSANTPVDSDAA